MTFHDVEKAPKCYLVSQLCGFLEEEEDEDEDDDYLCSDCDANPLVFV